MNKVTKYEYNQENIFGVLGFLSGGDEVSFYFIYLFFYFGDMMPCYWEINSRLYDSILKILNLKLLQPYLTFQSLQVT
jgi:hypothetical protein